MNQKPAKVEAPKEKATTPLRGAEAVGARNDWYRDRYTFVLRIAFLVAIVAVIEGAVIAGLLMNRPEPRYFAVDARGGVVPIVPVDRPLLSNDALTAWAAETARKAYSLDFVNYAEQMQSLRDRFNPPAYKAYVQQMDESGNLAAIKDRKMVMQAEAQPAVITRSAVAADGRYTWDVEVPLVVIQHFGASQQRSQRLLVTLQITRVDNRFRPETGVVVTKLLTRLA